MIPLGAASRRRSSDRAGRRVGHASRRCRRALPYLVLLPMGFAVPFPLPEPRCALTAPFHPCRPLARRRRSILCCTFRRLTPPRSEERRGGKERVRTVKFWWAPEH